MVERLARGAEQLRTHVRVGAEHLLPLGERLLPRRLEQQRAEALALLLGLELGRRLPREIVEHPRHFPVVYRGVRRALTRRFPFAVFFVLEPERIIVLAIHRQSSDPRRWKDRLD
jgi:hypothetical protein